MTKVNIVMAGRNVMDWLHGEPELTDVLSDPMVLTVMARDGVEKQDLTDLLRHIEEGRQEAAIGSAAETRRPGRG